MPTPEQQSICTTSVLSTGWADATCRTRLKQSCNSHVSAMEQPWNSHMTAMQQSWNSHGTDGVRPAARSSPCAQGSGRTPRRGAAAASRSSARAAAAPGLPAGRRGEGGTSASRRTGKGHVAWRARRVWGRGEAHLQGAGDGRTASPHRGGLRVAPTRGFEYHAGRHQVARGCPDHVKVVEARL